MFSTFKQRLILGVYIFILLSIPVGAYLASQNQNTKSQAKEQKTTKPKNVTTPKATTSSAKGLLDLAQTYSTPGASTAPTPAPSSSAVATSFGPTLSFKVALEGRPQANQASRMFVGIAEGTLSTNPKFLLSFTVDVPASGEYSGLSLAGLNSGSRYTALFKGSAQIATTSAFTMSPATTALGTEQAIYLLSGDLNEDNVINTADYSIAQKVLGQTSSSLNWNSNIDLNKDGIINTFDLGIISKNIGKVGASGAWTSPIPTSTATPSASLSGPPQGSPLGGSGQDGYWIWVPNTP